MNGSAELRAPDRSVLEIDSGIEALQTSPAFRGPVESIDGHDSNEHMALLYEDRTERLAATVPYLRQGLERGEQCLCVLEGSFRDAVIEGMRDEGVDVESAIESGALLFHTVDETYLRNGSFDPDEMLSFYADAIAETAHDYEGLRVTATAEWVLDESVPIESFMTYESKVNDLFRGVDCIALCQYDRNRFPPDVLRDVIRTHPHLVYDDTICHNFYYTPPDEFGAPNQERREIDRTMRTLVERSEAKAQLQERERALEKLYQTVADPNHSFETKVRRVLELGRDYFDLEYGAFSRISGGSYESVETVGDHPAFEPGTTTALAKTYCRRLFEREGPLTMEHAAEEGWEGDVAYEFWEHESYIGTTITLGNEVYGSLCFADSESRDRPFTEDEATFLELTSQWIGYELEREHREAQLAALNEMARDLMNGETRAGIAETAVEHAAETVALPVTAVVTFDRETGTLTPLAETDRASQVLDTAALCDREDGPFWDAFVENEVQSVDDPDSRSNAAGEVTEVVAVPLGTEGLLITATRGRNGFCPTERDFVRATAATIEAASVRADRERKLQERERTLEQQNETLERIDRVNDIIRSIDQALVQASTRSEIDRVVCEQLATVGPYELAWIGDDDPVTGGVTPRESAGLAASDLGALATEGNAANGPLARAVDSREPQVANDILADESCDPWRHQALNRGYHAAVMLPLIYEDRLYGVLNVYAGQPGVFDDLERSVLAELSDTIAYAINAVENKRSRVGGESTVLEFAVDDANLQPLLIARETGANVSIDTVVRRADGQLRGYFTTRGASAEEVRALEPALPLSRLECIDEREAGGERTCHFETSLTDDSFAAAILEHGGRLRELSVIDGSATVVVELAAAASVREFVDVFQNRYPDSRLVAQRTDGDPTPTAASFHETLTEDLTPRQLEAIQTAYFSGFFERPRPQTGSEIATAMDISQPTFNGHLRAAQRKLCRKLFEPTET